MRALHFSTLSLSMTLLAGCGGSSGPNVVIVQDDAGPEVDAVIDAPADADARPGPGEPPACVSPPAPAGAPSPRGDVAAAMDASGQHLVVFGGDTAVPTCPISGVHAHSGETWILDVGCGTWRQITSDGPPARARASMALDRAGGRAILFGGRARGGSSGPYTLFNDVWAFDFKAETWAQITTSGTGPSPRSNTAAVIDGKGNRLIVFGGNVDNTGTRFTPRSDTWALDLASGAWKGVGDPAATKPQARLFHAMAVDDDAGVAYVFSGGDSNAFTGPFLDDVWALDLAGESWSAVATTGEVAPGRIAHAASFDRTRKRLVVFGGHDDGKLGNQNDVWTLDVTTTPAAWAHAPGGDTYSKPARGDCDFPADFSVIDKASPERREAFAIGARADGTGFVVYGGKSDCGLLADAWWWNDVAQSWKQIVKTPVGVSCLRYSTTCSGLCG